MAVRKLRIGAFALQKGKATMYDENRELEAQQKRAENAELLRKMRIRLAEIIEEGRHQTEINWYESQINRLEREL